MLDTAGHESVLHSFTGPDGASPQAGLVRDQAGNLYGTTLNGGGATSAICTVIGYLGCGVAFKLDASSALTVLHAFTGGSDGASPAAALVLDSSGNLYSVAKAGGTTGGCGGPGCWVIFKLDASGALTPLYSFTGGQDGAAPVAALSGNPATHLFGATLQGGYANACAQGCGVVFRIAP
jgi:hypothetical protein